MSWCWPDVPWECDLRSLEEHPLGLGFRGYLADMDLGDTDQGRNLTQRNCIRAFAVSSRIAASRSDIVLVLKAGLSCSNPILPTTAAVAAPYTTSRDMASRPASTLLPTRIGRCAQNTDLYRAQAREKLIFTGGGGWRRPQCQRSDGGI